MQCTFKCASHSNVPHSNVMHILTECNAHGVVGWMHCFTFCIFPKMACTQLLFSRATLASVDKVGGVVYPMNNSILQTVFLTKAVYPELSCTSGSPPLSISDLIRLTLPSSAACQIPRSKSISVKDWAYGEGFDEQSQPSVVFPCSQDPSIAFNFRSPRLFWSVQQLQLNSIKGQLSNPLQDGQLIAAGPNCAHFTESRLCFKTKS